MRTPISQAEEDFINEYCHNCIMNIDAVTDRWGHSIQIKCSKMGYTNLGVCMGGRK
jgi:hypothetical protein